jgi:hypothetical protein
MPRGANLKILPQRDIVHIGEESKTCDIILSQSTLDNLHRW